MTRSAPTARRVRAGHLWLGLALSGLGACVPGRAPAGSDPDVRAEIATGVEVCSAGTVERRPLVLPDGLHAYVEPGNLMEVEGEYVVVGAPSYTWGVGGPLVEMRSEREHIAAYLDESSPRLVEQPLDIRVDGTGVKSVPLGGPRWGVILPEAHPDTAESGAGVRSVWYAEYDGAGWSTPEALPLPPEQRLFVGSSSALVEIDGTLSWAVLDLQSETVLLYERVAGSWRYTTVPDSDVEAVALGTGPSGTWLALSGLDPGITGPIKSVRLYHRESNGWRLVTRDPTTEPYTEIDKPHLMVLPAGVTVTWTELRGQGVVIARVGVTPQQSGRVVVVDEAGAVVRPFSVHSGEPAWVVQHNDVVRRAAELRVLRLAGPDVRSITTIPYPYTGFYIAHAVGPGAVLVTGSEFDPDPARPTVRSLTLRLSPSC